MAGRRGDDLIGTAVMASVTTDGSPARAEMTPAQREALDKFAGEKLTLALSGYAASFVRWKEANAELETLRTEARERLREAESLRRDLQGAQ